jgi:spore maturation protein CgeB
VPGAGGFLLTQHAEGLDRHFRLGEEVAVFRTADELIDQVRSYLGHSDARDRVANAGHRRTAEHHTYSTRFAEILARAPRESDRKRKWTLKAADLAPAFGRHRGNAWLRLLRGAVAGPLSLIFGAERGRRAARRLLYELSWRFAGEATYRASGWPGRLFFRES